MQARHGSSIWSALSLGFSCSLALLFYGYFIYRSSFLLDGMRAFTLFDDAMISLTYARTLAEGHGLVWFPQAPTVEGYTNFLWVVWMAVLHLTGAPDRLQPLLVMLSGVVILLLLARELFLLAQNYREEPLYTGAFVATFGLFYFPLVFWSLRGMEVGLMALLLTRLAREMLDERSPATWGSTFNLISLSAMLILLRTDSLIPCLALAAFAMVGKRDRSRDRKAIVLLLALAATFALHSIFRFVYYGSWLPNTYYLKLHLVPLSERFARGFYYLWFSFRSVLWPLLPPLFVFLWVRRGKWASKDAVVALPLLLTFSYHIYIGGDVWDWCAGLTNRFLTPVIPFLALWTAIGTAACWSKVRPALPEFVFRSPVALGVATGLLFALATSRVALHSMPSPLHLDGDKAEARVGYLLNQVTSPSTVLGVTVAGAIPYFSRRRAVDLLGKSDPVIARLPPKGKFHPGHNKYDYAYSASTHRIDLITRLWEHTDEDLRRLRALGYEPLNEQMWAQPTNPLLQISRLAALKYEVP